MKKFNLKGVFEGFRSSVAHTTKQELEFQENLKSYDFFIKRVSRFKYVCKQTLKLPYFLHIFVSNVMSGQFTVIIKLSLTMI